MTTNKENKFELFERILKSVNKPVEIHKIMLQDEIKSYETHLEELNEMKKEDVKEVLILLNQLIRETESKIMKLKIELENIEKEQILIEKQYEKAIEIVKMKESFTELKKMDDFF